MMSLLGVVAFVVALLISVTLHEWGHFSTARHYGMKASKFFVGFGPTLWSVRRGETEYGVKAIPAGGFVKIIGMTPLEEVEPGDEARAFYRYPARQRSVVLVAGSFMHFVLALVLVYGVTLFIGVAEPDAPVVGQVSTCVPLHVDDTCSDNGAIPAPAAGVLKPDDRITAVNGTSVATWEDVVRKIRANPGQSVHMTVSRDGEPVAVTVTPVTVTRPGLDDPKTKEQVGAVGVAQGTGFRDIGPVAAIGQTGKTFGQMLTGTYHVLADKFGTLTKLYSPDRDPAGFVGVVGISRVSGDVFATQDVPFSLKIAQLLFIVAGVNLFVGIFNLLPLLPLDGGHLAVIGYEEVRDKLLRLRGYRGPKLRVDMMKLMPVTYAVMIFFIGLTLYIAGADIVNPIKLNQ